MVYPVFVVPGIGNSGPLHWQSVWEASHPDWQRLVVEDWDQVACDDWVSAIEHQLAQSDHDTLIVAHSLGCLAVAHWASRYSPRIRGRCSSQCRILLHRRFRWRPQPDLLLCHRNSYLFPRYLYPVPTTRMAAQSTHVAARQRGAASLSKLVG